MDPKKRKLMLHFALLGLTALSARFLLLYAAGPQWVPDTVQYLSVSRTLAETGTFSAPDPATGKMEPFAMRVPLFHAFTAAIIKLAGPEMGTAFYSMNILLSAAIVLLTAALFYSLAGLPAGLLAGYLVALDPNSIYYSLLVLPDTMFSLFVLLSALAGLGALRSGSLKRYLGWGALIGLAALVKPAFKYFWAVPPLLLLGEAALREKALKKTAVLALGFALVAAPWLARNYALLDFAGFELTFGVNTLWSTTDLVRPSTAEQVKKDPVLAGVRDLVAAAGEPMLAMAAVKAKLNLPDKEVNRYLFAIGRETALQNPFKFGYRYAKNAVNLIASGSSAVELSYKLLPGGENYKKAVADSLAAGKRLPDGEKLGRLLKDAVANKTWPALLLNAAARAVFLAFFIAAMAGFLVLFRTDRTAALLLLSVIAYFVLLSSFTSGYDRYRLPVDPLLAGLAAVFIDARRRGKPSGQAAVKP